MQVIFTNLCNDTQLVFGILSNSILNIVLQIDIIAFKIEFL